VTRYCAGAGRYDEGAVMGSIRRLAIANRGEAAMRCLSAAAELGAVWGEPVSTIALYTEPDAASWFVREADEAVLLGPAMFTGADGRRRSTYTDTSQLMAALSEARADAVWPGWGFAAESAEFAAACERAGITFIGPPSDIISLMGDKVRAKRLAESAGVPDVPWSGGAVPDAQSARAAARLLGYPVMVKAAAGGGGHGIRSVESEGDLAAAFASAQAEAQELFGDPAVFIERQLTAARHVEVQVVGDGSGTVWAVGIRDCSIQRRHQKVIEESGCTLLDRTAERELREAAIRLCRAAGYRNAGTVEFLLDPVTRQFMFMEVNARLQVEHPVTEMTTGLDLVKLQLHVARGGRLHGRPPSVRGYAIEARLNAEDPENGFAAAPGRVSALRLPAGPGIRVDTGVAQGDQIAPEFDSMIAKIVAWGRDRDEALGRLRRALAQSVVVVDGGTTNKAFLLGLTGRAEVHAGTHHNHWLDRLAGSGGCLPDQHPVALLAAAIEAAEADQAAVQANFLAAAARGRPELPDGVGHQVQLRMRGNPYRMHVNYLGGDDYRVDTAAGRIDARMQFLGQYERVVTCQGRRYRIVASTQGPRLLVEVDGLSHVLTRDDGGQVRSPSPAFVVAVLVGAGDTVRAGDPLVVAECMKMENTITAPYSGTVTSVLADVNTQVEAGAPLVQLQAADHEELDPASAPIDLAGLAGVPVPSAGMRPAGAGAVPGRVAVPGAPWAEGLDREGDARLRAYLLGYDLGDDEARELGHQREAMLATLSPGNPALLRTEQELLEIFADVAALSRRVPEEDVADEHARSSQEYLLTYLAFLDPERSGSPGHFLNQLRAALARYGVDTLKRTPELERALLRVYRSVSRMPATAPIVIAILDRWRRAGEELAPAMTGERLAVLDRLILTTQGRQQEVCDLAREVRFQYVDAPLLKASRTRAYAGIAAHVGELSGKLSPQRRRELTDRLVWFPLPMRAVLRDSYRRADASTRARLLEVRTRRYYRIRDLTGLRCQKFGSYLTCLADYADSATGGGPTHLVSAYVPIAELPAFAEAVARHLRGLPPGRHIVVDIDSWRSDPFSAEENMASELAGLLACARFGRDLYRLDITVTSESGGDGHAEEHLRTQHFSYRQTGNGLTEDLLFRNMHPMIAERLELWRLSNFSLKRLPSAEDVYLFDAVATANPKDERLIALAEVRDLTAARDPEGRIIGYPHLEGMVTQALADVRRALDGRPSRQRPLSNRVILYVRPAWEIGASVWRGLAHRLAPLAAGLGLEKVAVRIHTVEAATGERREAVLDVENLEDGAVTVRMRPRSERPIQPLTEYRQKVLRSQRLGAPYPYELIRMLTPPVGAPADFPAGHFTEYDLPDEGAGQLEPVDRPYGRNRAGVVAGVITNYTELVPEGMRRVAILGDPTAGLGNLAEPECRRILAALDLAAELQVPVEWFALSSGARIAWDSGTENMDWVAAVLRRLVEFTQADGEVNVVVTGINVGAQPYWNAEATVLMHTRGILVMTPASAMVLTGKSSLDFSGGVSAEDNLGIGGFERIMGPNGQAQYWAPSLAGACAVLLHHYGHTYVVPGEPRPRRAPTRDPADRDVCLSPHRAVMDTDFASVGDIFSAELNGDRKKPFDMRSVMRAVADSDDDPFERWAHWRDAENTIVWEARIGGFPVCLIGFESRTVSRGGFVPADGPPSWTAGTLFPQSSRKLARAVNAASGNRPVVVLANLSGFDGSPESMRKWQLEYGAEIGRAVTNFRGPIVFVVVSRYHGGAFVVFSKRLHEDMETAAVAGSFASVIGGAPAAAVVLSREVTARTWNDPRVTARRDEIESAAGGGLGDLHAELADIVQAVRAEKLKEVADEFDNIHDIRRAMRVGSVDRIIAPCELRPFIAHALERRLTATARPATGVSADGQPHHLPDRPGQPITWPPGRPPSPSPT
jgi:acetyl/propionyl-CoA carboxylase alpha subunit/acetyl-CoA carboxylase carboxyltransferase component